MVKQGSFHIGDYAFDGCDRNTSVVVEGDSFMTIGKMLSDVQVRKSISFSEEQIVWSEYAFYSTGSLTSVDLSDAQMKMSCVIIHSLVAVR